MINFFRQIYSFLKIHIDFFLISFSFLFLFLFLFFIYYYNPLFNFNYIIEYKYINLLFNKSIYIELNSILFILPLIILILIILIELIYKPYLLLFIFLTFIIGFILQLYYIENIDILGIHIHLILTEEEIQNIINFLLAQLYENAYNNDKIILNHKLLYSNEFIDAIANNRSNFCSNIDLINFIKLYFETHNIILIDYINVEPIRISVVDNTKILTYKDIFECFIRFVGIAILYYVIDLIDRTFPPGPGAPPPGGPLPPQDADI
jgi:hypothetical protein